MAAELRTRRNATPFLVRVYDERRLRLTASPDVRHFLARESNLAWTGCPGGGASTDCLVHRTRVVTPRVYIDDFRRDLEELVSFAPDEIFQLETFTCRASVEIRVYTADYMEQMAKRPRILLPACSGWE
jgi:hypothetical protein